MACHPFRRDRFNAFPEIVQPVEECRQSPWPSQVLGIQHIEDRQHEQGIRPRPDEQVLIRDPRRLGPSGIDHHDLPAALLDRLQAFRDVRNGHQAAIGHQRIASHDDKELGPIDVRHRQQQLMPKEQRRDQMVRQLVQRRGRKAIPRAQCSQERRREQQRAVVVDAGIPQVDRHRVVAVLSPNRLDPSSHLVKSLVPADALHRARFAAADV